MSTQANVILRFLVSGQNSVSGVIDKLSAKKKELAKPVTIPIDADADDAEITIDKVRAEADALNKKRAEITIDAEDKSAQAKLLAIDMRLERLNKYLARPGVDLQGKDQTLLGIYRISAAMDKLNGKKATVKVETKTSTNRNSNVISRILPGGGGSSSGGAFSGPFQGVAGVGSGASAGVIEALTSPVGAGSALAALPFLGTGVAGGILGGLGAGLAGVGIAGGLGAGQSNPKDIAAADDTLHAAQQRVIADQAKLNALQKSGKATTAQLASAHAALSSAHASVSSAQDKRDDLGAPMSKATLAAQASFKTLSTNAKKSLATIGASFAPVMSTIFKVANTTLGKLTPVFAGAEKTISGPFQQVGTILATSLASPAVVTSVKGLADSFGQFLKGFAPQIPGIVNALANGVNGMASAFTDHPGLIKGMGSVLAFLLKIPGFVAGALGSLTRVTAWLIGGLPHAVSIGLDAAREFFINIGHGIEAVWDNVWDTIKSITSTGASVLASFWSTITGPFIAGYNFVLGIFDKIKHFITDNFDTWWAANGEAVITVWTGIWMKVTAVASTLWAGILSIIKGFIGAITIIFDVAKQVIVGIWDAIWFLLSRTLQTVWALILGTIEAGWTIIKTIFTVGTGVLATVWGAAWSVIKLVVQQAWNIIVAAVKLAWDVIVGLFTVFINLITGRWGAAWNGFYKMMVQVWNLIKSTTSSSVQFLEGIFRTFVNFVLGIFAAIIHGAASLFGWVPGVGGKLKSAAKAFDNFRDDVNRALGGVNNKNVKVSVAMTASSNPYAGGISGRAASGGRISGPGTGTSDTAGLYALSNGEWVVRADSASRYGMAAMSAVNQGKAVIQYASGGPVGDPSGGNVSVSTQKPSYGSIYSGISSQLTSLVKNNWEKMMASVGSVGGSGVTRWSGLVLQVLSMLGQSSSWLSTVLRRMNQESGGNPNAINNWDSNAAAGDPSRGLMQTIGATFAAYAGPFLGLGIYNPLANIYAGLNYALHRYGSLAALNRPGGYANGTGGAKEGWAWVGENGPELVLFQGGEKVIANHNLPGYAKGTTSAEINAGVSLYLGYLHADLLSIAKIQADQKTFLKDISRYYNGHSASWRDNMINKQTAAMEAAAAKLTKMEANFKNAQSYANTVKSNLSSFSGISDISPSTQVGTSGSGIVQGLTGKLSTLKSFASAITKLRQKGVSAAIIRQIIDMGPEQGLPYAKQLLNASSGTVKKINSLESQIGSEISTVGNSAAFAVYGVNVAKGLASQEKPLKDLMKRLGAALGKEAAAWLHVPKGKLPKGYATGTSNATRGWHVVGENGPEMLFFRGGEKVVPAGGIRGGDGASSPTMININVSPTPLARPADIGREVVTAIRQYEKGSGKSWRS